MLYNDLSRSVVYAKFSKLQLQNTNVKILDLHTIEMLSELVQLIYFV